MRTLFIADVHFGNESIIELDRRPWNTVEEMDEGLIRCWNEKVRPEDHVYVLGDFAYDNRIPVSEYTKRLNGFIHLIRGNHDDRSEAYESCFYEVADYKELAVTADNAECHVILSHYFMPFYNGAHCAAIMLHGHTHKTFDSCVEEELKEIIREKGLHCMAYNVGAVWQNYEPMTLEEIIAGQGKGMS